MFHAPRPGENLAMGRIEYVEVKMLETVSADTARSCSLELIKLI